MKNIYLLGLIFGFTMAAADPAEEVRCREIGFSKSIEARDMEAFRSYLDDDARFVGGRVRRGPDEITEGWRTYEPEDGPTSSTTGARSIPFGDCRTMAAGKSCLMPAALVRNHLMKSKHSWMQRTTAKIRKLGWTMGLEP
jgi:ketosteroid isomerase-like protein